MGTYLHLLRKSHPVTAKALLDASVPPFAFDRKIKIHRLTYLCKPWNSQFYYTDGVPPVLHLQRCRGEKTWAKHEGGVFYARLDHPKATGEFNTPNLRNGDSIYYVERAFSEWWDCNDKPGHWIGVFYEGTVISVDAWEAMQGEP